MKAHDCLTAKPHARIIQTQHWGAITIRALKGSDYPRLMAILSEPAGAMRLAGLVQLGCVTPEFAEADIPTLAAGPMEPLNVIGLAVLEDTGLDLGEDEKKSSPAMSTPPTSSPRSLATPIRTPCSKE